MKTLFCLLFVFSPLAYAHADAPSVHGMLLLGGANHLYISHLPMFHSPHDYQAIAEVELPPALQKALIQSHAAHPTDTLYTLVPENFSLPEMFAHPKPFHADLYHGHFERGGDVIVSGNVTIKRVLFFRKFVPGETRKGTSYLLFGSNEEAFLAHFIIAKPDFDQLLSAKAEVAEGSAEKLDAAGTLAAPGAADLAGKHVEVLKELYFETGDLAH